MGKNVAFFQPYLRYSLKNEKKWTLEVSGITFSIVFIQHVIDINFALAVRQM